MEFKGKKNTANANIWEESSLRKGSAIYVTVSERFRAAPHPQPLQQQVLRCLQRHLQQLLLLL